MTELELELATDEMMGLFKLSDALSVAMENGLVLDGMLLSLEDGTFNVKLISVRE